MPDANATTTFQEAYATFSAAIETTKGELVRVNDRLDALSYERIRVEQAAPHTEDIVAMFQRGLQGATANFRSQLADHLKETFSDPMKPGGAAAAVKGKGRDFLSIGSSVLDRDIVRARQESRPYEMPLGVAAVTYMLREKLAAEIPALVDQLFPDARTGLKAADRQQQLQAIDTEVADLKAQKTQLEADLAAARATVNRGRG